MTFYCSINSTITGNNINNVLFGIILENSPNITMLDNDIIPPNVTENEMLVEGVGLSMTNCSNFFKHRLTAI